MGNYYTPTEDSDYRAVCDEMLQTYHMVLVQAGLKIDLLEVRPDYDENGDALRPAVTAGGYQALGVCRIINQRDRAKGNGDVEIAIDGDWWDNAEHEERCALMDHELNHIELVLTDGGELKRDVSERPKVKIRKHDRQFGWFDEVASRHGRHSIEHKQAASMLKPDAKQTYQLEFPILMEKTSDERGASSAPVGGQATSDVFEAASTGSHN
jgi:hypothetical protein